jgi:Zn-dependent M28 family amino/carboxypeptidase
MKKHFYKIFFILLFFGNGFGSFSQTLNPFFQNIVNQVSYDSLLNTLKKIELLGVKTAPSPALSNASVWLYNKYLSYGYTNIKRDSFLNSSDTLLNIIVTKTGTTHPESILVICGHYDSESGPGVNDNGSGVSIILEIARLLKNIPTEYSIKFINFTGEEQGFWGSHHYVDYIAVPQNQDIFLVFNIDEVGGIAGLLNNIIKCEKDLSSPQANNALSSAYTDTLSNLVHQYSSLQTEFSNAYGSDYVPFQQSGFVITGLFEKNQSSVVHSTDDRLINLDTSYVFEIAKASVGASLYLAKAFLTTQTENIEKKKQ